MRTFGWLLLGLVAFAIHELVLSAATRDWLRARAIRYSLLLTAVASTAMAAPGVVGWLDELVPSGAAQPGLFAPSGDAFFADALALQHPDTPFPAGQSSDAVEAWRRHVVAALREQAGVFVDAPSSVAVTTLNSENVGVVRRSLVRFTSWDGTTIPAYVLEPAAGVPKGGVLVVAGHGVGIRATGGVVADYQHGAALELAKQGYVTLTPELRGFGFLGVEGAANHRWVAAAALEAGTSYKAIVARDLGYALTVLGSWPRVDPGRLAVAGTSLGGELAVLFGALDPRIRVVLSHSYGGAVGPLTIQEDEPDDARQTPHGCHTIPGVNRILVQEDWARLVAPRPLLVVRGDRNAPADPATFEKRVREAFTVHGDGDRFLLAIEPGGHEFYLEPSVQFLARWL